MAHQLGLTLDGIYSMSSKEYMGWVKYFKERPYGWRDDHRAAVLTQTTYQGKKKLEINELFPSLKAFSEADKNQINKAKVFIDKMQALTGNVVIDTNINTKD